MSAMKRMLTALISVVVVGGSLLAQAQTQTPPPPPGQTTPPAGQKPPVPPPLVPAPAKPAPVPFPPDAKVAYVQFQLIVQESKQGKCGQEAMKKFQDDHSKELLTKQKAAKDLSDKIDSQKGIVSDAVINSMSRDLDKMQREFNMMQDQVKADQESLNQQLLEEFQNKVIPIVEAMRAEKGLWMVLAVPESQIVAANTGLDLSLEAVKRLDDKFPTCPGKAGGGD